MSINTPKNYYRRFKKTNLDLPKVDIKLGYEQFLSNDLTDILKETIFTLGHEIFNKNIGF